MVYGVESGTVCGRGQSAKGWHRPILDGLTAGLADRLRARRRLAWQVQGRRAREVGRGVHAPQVQSRARRKWISRASSLLGSCCRRVTGKEKVVRAGRVGAGGVPAVIVPILRHAPPPPCAWALVPQRGRAVSRRQPPPGNASRPTPSLPTHRAWMMQASSHTQATFQCWGGRGRLAASQDAACRGRRLEVGSNRP